jgi:hypothetical protein
MRTPIFSQQKLCLSPQNGGFIRAFWPIPIPCGKGFRADTGSPNCFFNKVCKKYLTSNNRSKQIIYNQNTKDQDKLNFQYIGMFYICFKNSLIIHEQITQS